MLLEDLENEQRTRSNLSRFLPKPVVDQALDGKLELALGGSTCKGTIFFADVIGFTRMSEQLSPEDVIGMMNSFFNRMVPCIEAENGAIDKFMGDCIMAFWGIPFDTGEAPFQAISAGLTMQNLLIGLNSLREESGKPLLHMGVGMESGEVVAGNIGSEDRVEYTVLGNTVNTADRVQRCAGRGQVLGGEGTWGEIRERAYAICLPPVEVKNKAKPITVYSVRGIMTDNEVLLHVPVRIDGRRAVLTRRLAEGDFVLLHASDQEPDGQHLISDMVEMSETDLGPIKVVAHLPDQVTDGRFKRSQVLLDDGTLGGLLAEAGKSVDGQLNWEDMTRAASVV